MADVTAFDRSVLDRALGRLGELVSTDIRIVLAGGSALLYLPGFTRGTNDGDVIAAAPTLSTIASEILAVAGEMRLPDTWLNDGARAWADFLPLDYGTRIEAVARHGRLTVDRLGRLDLIVLKFAGTRPKDQDDLRDLAPTSTEIAFVRAQLERIHRVSPRAALRAELYLDQYGEPRQPAPVIPQGRRRKP